MKCGLTDRLFLKPFAVQLHKYDCDTLRYKDAFDFETWIISQYGGVANTKQKNDFGTGAEFYAWDWEYDEEKAVFRPEILRDREGRQIRKFKSGTHCIAVKAVDNDGLENMESIKLKVNGNIAQERKQTE